MSGYELIKRGACLFLFMILQRSRDEVKKDVAQLNEIVLKTPKHACDVGNTFVDPENSFKEYFRIICTRKINVVLLVLKGTVKYAPLG